MKRILLFTILAMYLYGCSSPRAVLYRRPVGLNIKIDKQQIYNDFINDRTVFISVVYWLSYFPFGDDVLQNVSKGVSNLNLHVIFSVGEESIELEEGINRIVIDYDENSKYRILARYRGQYIENELSIKYDERSAKNEFRYNSTSKKFEMMPNKSMNGTGPHDQKH